MITGTLTNKDQTIPFSLPESWDEVPFEMFLKVYGKELTDIQMMSALTGIDVDVLNRCNKKEVNWILYNVEKNLDPNSLSDVEQISSFEFEGKTYSCSDISNESYGQWTDSESELKQIEAGKLERLPYLIAINFLTIGEDYSWLEAEKKGERFKNIPVTTIMGLRDFFLSREIQSLTDSPEFFQEKKDL